MHLGNLAGMGGWVGSKPTTPMGGTPAGGTPVGGSTPVMGSPQHRPQTAGAWQGQPPGVYNASKFLYIKMTKEVDLKLEILSMCH